MNFDEGFFDDTNDENRSEEIEQGALSNLAGWIAKTRNKDGMACRSAVLVWMFHPGFRPLTLTQLSGLFGMSKQSIGRQAMDFKDRFPDAWEEFARQNTQAKHYFKMTDETEDE